MIWNKEIEEAIKRKRILDEAQSQEILENAVNPCGVSYESVQARLNSIRNEIDLLEDYLEKKIKENKWKSQKLLMKK